jgi:hypothetical protein
MFLVRTFGSPHRKSQGEVGVQARKESVYKHPIGQTQDKPLGGQCTLILDHDHSCFLSKKLVVRSQYLFRARTPNWITWLEDLAPLTRELFKVHDDQGRL